MAPRIRLRSDLELPPPSLPHQSPGESPRPIRPEFGGGRRAGIWNSAESGRISVESGEQNPRKRRSPAASDGERSACV